METVGEMDTLIVKRQLKVVCCRLTSEDIKQLILNTIPSIIVIIFVTISIQNARETNDKLDKTLENSKDLVNRAETILSEDRIKSITAIINSSDFSSVLKTSLKSVLVSEYNIDRVNLMITNLPAFNVSTTFPIFRMSGSCNQTVKATGRGRSHLQPAYTRSEIDVDYDFDSTPNEYRFASNIVFYANGVVMYFELNSTCTSDNGMFINGFNINIINDSTELARTVMNKTTWNNLVNSLNITIISFI